MRLSRLAGARLIGHGLVSKIGATTDGVAAYHMCGVVVYRFVCHAHLWAGARLALVDAAVLQRIGAGRVWPVPVAQPFRALVAMGFVGCPVIVVSDVESFACEHLLRANHAKLGARQIHTASRFDALVELVVAMGFGGVGRMAIASSRLAFAAALKSLHDNPKLFQTPRIFLPEPTREQ